MASTRVVFPLSTWAMMAMLRIWSVVNIVEKSVLKANEYSDGLGRRTQRAGDVVHLCGLCVIMWRFLANPRSSQRKADENTTYRCQRYHREADRGTARRE